MASKKFQVQTVIFKEGDWWVAQCLEYDIAAQARTIKDLTYEIQRVLVGHMVACKQEGITPFSNLPKAPEKYWQMFQDGLAVSPPSNIDFRIAQDVQVPTPELHLVG
jgi:hypothetical protein